MKRDLSSILSEWPAPGFESAPFKRGVWARIEAGSVPGNWIGRVLAAAARPRVAAALAALAIVFGAFTGVAMSRASGSEMYLRSVNPYAMNR